VGWRAYLLRLDYLLLAVSLGLVAYGVTMVYFATRTDVSGAPLYHVRQQIIAVVLGLVAAGAITILDYEIYRRFQWVLYSAAVLILVAVIPLGQDVNGARRWIDLGFTRFQPSAAALLLITLAIGAFLADRMELMGSKRVTAMALGLVALPALLVYQEPDFGSAVVMVMLALAMLYFYGAPWTHFAALFASAVVVFVAALEALP
jgi:rod shape determining protein RodA